MAIEFYDEPIFQTPTPGLTTVRWKLVTIVDDAVVEVTDWSTEDVVEVAEGNYYMRIPIDDTYPSPLIIIADTGEPQPFTRAILALKFRPETLTEVKSGGGTLSARIGYGSLSRRGEYLEIVQGEHRDLTIIVEADGRFDNAVAEEITVRIKDPKKNVVTIPNGEIARITERLDIQVIIVGLSPAYTGSLQGGVCEFDIVFDSQIAKMKHAVKIIEDIE